MVGSYFLRMSSRHTRHKDTATSPLPTSNGPLFLSAFASPDLYSLNPGRPKQTV
jgi:hypothetical protein